MRERWLSGRAVSLHAAVLVLVPGCAVAAWWQVNRAQDGNQLSYFYSAMWPVFGLLGLYFWWMLVHTDYDTVGLRGMRRQQGALEGTRRHQGAPEGGAASPAPPPVVTESAAAAEEEDPELAAYNARLAELSAKGPKTWRNRDPVVVRRAQ